MNNIKDCVMHELTNYYEVKKAEFYNQRHAKQKDVELHFVDLLEDGQVNHKAIEEKCAKMIAHILNGKNKVDDIILDNEVSYNEQMDVVIDALKVAIAESLSECTKEEGVTFNPNEMDLFLFNKHPDTEESRDKLKKLVYHEMVASLLPFNVNDLRKVCNKVFHKYSIQDLSPQERRAITHGIEATSEVEIQLIGKSFKKTRGDDLNTSNLEESLTLLKEMKDIFATNCHNSLYYRFKSHLFGNTGKFKKLIKSFKNEIAHKGVSDALIKRALIEDNGIEEVVNQMVIQGLRTYESVLEEKAAKAKMEEEKAVLKAEEEKRKLQTIEDRKKRIELQIELRKKQISELRDILRNYYPSVDEEEYEKLISTLERRKDYFLILKKFDESKEIQVRERMFNEEREISNMVFNHN